MRDAPDYRYFRRQYEKCTREIETKRRRLAKGQTYAPPILKDDNDFRRGCCIPLEESGQIFKELCAVASRAESTSEPVIQISRARLDGQVAQVLEQADALVEGGSGRQALALLERSFSYLLGERSRPELHAALFALYNALLQCGLEGGAEKAWRASESNMDFDSTWDLAYELYELKLFGLAASFLAVLLNENPNSEATVRELCMNLESLQGNDAARGVLRDHPALLEVSPMLRYLHRYYTLQSGDWRRAEQIAKTIGDDDKDSASALPQLLAMIERAKSVQPVSSLDRRDLRGWHLVVNGGLLLHVAPPGFDAGMNGRYASLTDVNGELYRYGIECLASL